MTTLEVGRGVCAEMNSLAVAMLRAEGFPARLVRIPAPLLLRGLPPRWRGKGHWISGDASKDDSILPNRGRRGVDPSEGRQREHHRPEHASADEGAFFGGDRHGLIAFARREHPFRVDQSGDEGELEDAGFASGAGGRRN